MTTLVRAIRRRWLLARAAADSGTALILALIVVLVIGTLLAAVLDFTKAGLTIVPGERDNRNTSNYIQGAVQGAINNIRGSSELGRTDSITPCPTYVPPAPVSTVSGVSGKTFSVSCQPMSTGSSAGKDRPRFAIQAVSTVAGEGIRQTSGNDELYIDGGIYSSQLITVTSGSQNSMRVNGTITAHTGCTGPITTTDPTGKKCNSTDTTQLTVPAIGVTDAPGPAIANAGALTTIINTGGADASADPVPTCDPVRGTIEFYPGLYTQTPEQLAQTIIPSCGETVYHLNTATSTTDGVYYFDYPGVWNIGTKRVIAGKWLSSTLGAGCDHDEDASPLAPGTQLIFGGSSQIQTSSPAGNNSGGIEVCGPEKNHVLSGGPQRIALYALSARDTGLTSNAAVTSSRVYTNSAGPTIPLLPPTLPNTWSNPVSKALDINNQSTTATFAAGGLTARLAYDKLAPFTTDPTSGLPKGSDVSQVVVHVKHVLTNSSARLYFTGDRLTPFDISLSTGSTCPPPSPPGNYCYDITSQLQSANDVTWRNFNSLRVTYEATADNSAATPKTAALDGIEFNVTYRAPGLHAITCNVSPCDFLNSKTNPNIFFHGTGFAPTGGFDVAIHNSGKSLFDRGVIVRDLEINMSASSKQTESPFQLPGGTPNGRVVLFKGTVNGVEKVRACVWYVDTVKLPNGFFTAYAGWSVRVPRWLVERTPTSAADSCPTPP